MITKKEFSKELRKSEIKNIENVFRQIVEEKPYLMAIFKEKKFHEEAKRILGEGIKFAHARDWLMGYRKRKFSKK